jgi:alpha-beta hydrolase superfamily lysophospholipase
MRLTRRYDAVKELRYARAHRMIVSAQHELLMEQDRFRSQFWAAFDAFVPVRRCIRARTDNCVE